jgi:catechol 2,3-dioxygenase-like lactoylglutathione lyase family enzyme
MIKSSFFHVGLTVSDMQRSVRFYRDCVGMEVVGEPNESPNPGYDALLGGVGLRLEICWLREGGLLLQLVRYLDGGGDALDLNHNSIGAPHLSFSVDDIDAKFAALRQESDLVFMSELVDLGMATCFYVQDPDGVPVEFCGSNGSKEAREEALASLQSKRPS